MPKPKDSKTTNPPYLFFAILMALTLSHTLVAKAQVERHTFNVV